MPHLCRPTLCSQDTWIRPRVLGQWRKKDYFSLQNLGLASPSSSPQDAPPKRRWNRAGFQDNLWSHTTEGKSQCHHLALGRFPTAPPPQTFNTLTWKTGAITEVIECLLAPVTDSGDLVLAGWPGANCLTSPLASTSSSVKWD